MIVVGKVSCVGCRRETFAHLLERHRGCGVANTAPKVALVANAPEVLVANRGVVSRHGKYADLEKRRAYMRAYMARRRAA